MLILQYFSLACNRTPILHATVHLPKLDMHATLLGVHSFVAVFLLIIRNFKCQQIRLSYAIMYQVRMLITLLFD